jgi:hypothetical protein
MLVPGLIYQIDFYRRNQHFLHFHFNIAWRLGQVRENPKAELTEIRHVRTTNPGLGAERSKIPAIFGSLETPIFFRNQMRGKI